MFETLIESSGGTKRRAGGTVLSMLVHAMVVAGAVQATERVVRSGAAARADTTVVFVEPNRPAVPAPDPSSEGVPMPVAPEALSEIIPPGVTPLGIPPVEIGVKAFDAAAVVGASTSTMLKRMARDGTASGGVAGVFASAEVDDPVVAVSQPLPRYPTALEQAGISGSVDLEYVVDTTGHAEAASVRVIASSHAAFEQAAEEAILAGVYRPARYRGGRVRQMVQQRVLFSTR